MWEFRQAISKMYISDILIFEMLFIPKINKDQKIKLSDIISDIGLVALASVVLPSVFDKYDLARVVLGLTATFIFWVTSLMLRR